MIALEKLNDFLTNFLQAYKLVTQNLERIDIVNGICYVVAKNEERDFFVYGSEDLDWMVVGLSLEEVHLRYRSWFRANLNPYSCHSTNLDFQGRRGIVLSNAKKELCS